MNNKNNDNYTTRHLAEASLLLAKNQKLLGLDRKGKIVYFIFADKKACQKLSQEFFFGECLVNAKTYYEAMATLKNRIFS